MKTPTKIMLVIFEILGILLIAGMAYLRLVFPPPLSKEATEKDFIKNQSNILMVADYLINSKYAELDIGRSRDRGVMFANSNGYVIIDDSKIVDAINILFIKGYEVIDKSGNTIYFQRSSRLMDFGSGIAYSIDGINKPQLEFLTKLESLSEQNWYYYEEDFNEFKRRGYKTLSEL